MEIASSTIVLRESALLLGDYSTYRRQLSQNLLAVRRRLGRTTKKGAKYSKKEDITAVQLRENHEYAKLYLLAAERAWAHAMHIKSLVAEDATGQVVSGQTRDHILNRLAKAVKHVKELSKLVLEREASGATDVDVLELRAYLAVLSGSLEFERQSEGVKTKEQLATRERWIPSIQHYSLARIVFASLLKQDGREIYKDFINNTIDPTIRYAAYQAKQPRTVSIPSLAIKFYPDQEAAISDLVKKIDSEAFVEQKPTAKSRDVAAATGEIPTNISWRGRTASLLDASIGQALAQATTAEKNLTDFLAKNKKAGPSKRANAYDDILIAYQDASDAARRACEELEKEGVDEGDARMQDLRVSNLAINYDLVSWRVGRNRVLIGGCGDNDEEGNDGCTLEDQVQRVPKRPRRDGKPWTAKAESRSRKLARLRVRLALYDSIMQSIESIKSLRGAMRDPSFVAELDAKTAYFRALRCLNIAISHDLLGNHLNALALVAKASSVLNSVQGVSILRESSSRSPSVPQTLDITPDAFSYLQRHIATELLRHQAVSELRTMEEEYAASAAAARSKQAGGSNDSAPLVERLTTFYPEPGLQVELTNLVAYPAKLQPVPVKPLFLDLAFNYLEYPGRAKEVEDLVPLSSSLQGRDTRAVRGDQDRGDGSSDKQEEKKGRGWFGFGR